MCVSNDFKLLTANTGIATASIANPNLDGSGSLATVVTAAQLGTIIKSVTIKAIAPVTTGMVRLFIQKTGPNRNILYKEVPIPVTPVLSNTPTPTPVLPMFETILVGDLKLEPGSSLVASTQNGDDFVIVADACDWDYTNPPTVCCNFKQVSAITGAEIIDVANPNLDGTGTITNVFTASNAGTTKGTLVKSVTIKALQSTKINGMVRLFISPNGVAYSLLREIPIPETTQSAYEPSFKQVVDLSIHLRAGYIIAATTQNGESFGITIEGEEWSYA